MLSTKCFNGFGQFHACFKHTSFLFLDIILRNRSGSNERLFRIDIQGWISIWFVLKYKILYKNQ